MILKILNLWSVGANPLLISKILFIKPKQVSIILNALRKKNLLAKYLLSMPKLGGSGIIVEVDESKFGRRKYNRGHLVEGVWVLGIVERAESRRIVLIPIKQRNAASLIKILKRFVNKYSSIYSDGWRGYSCVEKFFSSHDIVNHKYNFVDPLTGVHTNTIEGNWSSINVQYMLESKDFE